MNIRKGYWAAGVGGGIASYGVVGSVVPVASWSNSGGTCWLNDYQLLWQHGSHLETLNLQNGAYNPQFDAQGANALAASHGVYAATLDGLRISSVPGLRLPAYGVGDVGPDGSVIVLLPDGSIAGSGGIVPAASSVQALGGSDWVGLGPDYRPIASRPDLIPKTLAGHLYSLTLKADLVMYFAENGGKLMLHERSVNWGVVLTTGLPACWGPDFEEQPDGSIVVFYATSQAEAPGTLIRMVTNRGQFGPLDGI